MKQKAPHALCEECSLYRFPFVPTYAPEKAEIAIIGEGPGYNETVKGEPFVGQSGKLLHAAFERYGVDYENVWRSNIVCCRPPNNREPSRKEIKCCKPRLLAELEDFGGSIIVPVGKVAGDVMLEEAGYLVEKVSERRGHWFEWNGKQLVPTWHPAYVLRRPGSANEFFGDIQRALTGSPEHFLQDAPMWTNIETPHDLEKELQRVPKEARVAFDLETDQTMWYDRPDELGDEILMMGFAWRSDHGFVIHPDVLHSEWGIDILNDFFDRQDITFVAHNGKFDVIFLRTIGIEARTDFDTMLAHYTLWEVTGTHGLKTLALEYFGLEDYEQDLVQRYLRSRNDRYSKVPYNEMALYCAWDVVVTLELSISLEDKLLREGLFEWPFNCLLMPMQKALTEVEWEGIPIDRKYVEEWQDKLFDYADNLENEMQNIAEDPLFNPRSPQQVAYVLYDKLGLPRPRVRGVSPNSTAKKALMHIEEGTSEFVDTLRAYRRVHKMNRSYLKNLLLYADTEDRVHPSALIHGTEVGRLSFRNPAIQTIPRPYEDVYGAIVRGAFVAPPGWKFIVADYSQAELRVVAILSEEPFLLNAYKKGRDIHSEVAIGMYGDDFDKGQRVLAKMFNFSYIYGGSEYSFAEDAGLPIEKARAFVRDYNNLMPKLLEYKQNQFQLARTQGYVESPFGRRRRFPLITQSNLDDVRKASVHMPVASTASDLTQLSLIGMVDSGIHVVLTVHDSNGAIAPVDEAEDVAKEMQSIMVTTASNFFPQIPWVVDYDIRDRWSPLPEEIHGDQLRATFR